MNERPKRRGEFELIADFFGPLAKQAPGALGLLDDVALLDLTPGCQLVAKTDEIVGSVHFRLDDLPELVARKALRVNLSDLAAKGARPVGFLQALTLNDSIDDAYLARFAAGLREDIETFAVPLIGGDTTSGPGPLTIAITVLGEVEKGQALLRSGARPGDLIYVTGTIGDGALGLACLENKLRSPFANFLVSRYRLPQPRLGVGRALRGVGSASADISDGLAADVGHICKASGVGAVLECARIPLSPGARAAIDENAAWWPTLIAGGDDYEIAFTAAPERAGQLADIARAQGVPLTAVGRVVAGAGVSVVGVDGAPLHLTSQGFQHR